LNLNFYSLFKAIHRKDNNKPSPKQDQSEFVGKLNRSNGNYKMIATARAGDWEGRIEEVKTQKSRKDDSGQYCARHAAILRKVNGKEQRKNEAQIFETKKLFTSAEKGREDLSGKNSHKDDSTPKPGTAEKVETSLKDTESQEDSQKTCLDKRCVSDHNFPVVNVQRQTTDDRNRERRLFNFSGGNWTFKQLQSNVSGLESPIRTKGSLLSWSSVNQWQCFFLDSSSVTRKSTKADCNLPREDHRTSSSTDNIYFSFINDKEKQASISYYIRNALFWAFSFSPMQL
jgi:hypothetical protein